MTLRVGIAAMPTSAAGVELIREAERLGARTPAMLAMSAMSLLSLIHISEPTRPY